MAALFIEDIVAKLKRGELRIPAFQRGFVWSPDDVAFLMDSIYKGYPVGSILLWRTKNKLTQERDLGPFKIPEPTAEYPIDYVLDGQQRLTAILGVFATGLQKTNAVEWKDIYFDILSSDDIQSSQFFALSPDDVDGNRHFPLNIMFDSVQYRRATQHLSEDLQIRVDDLLKKFQKAQFPFHMVETDEIEKIAIVFERINRKGVALDTFQLLTAWTWTGDFELKQQFEELAGELEEFGFRDVAEDTDLILRCAAAVALDKESPESLLSVSGTLIRDTLPRVRKGIRESLDFLRANFFVQKLDNLPYPTSLIPLTAFFAGPENEHFAISITQFNTLRNWFWRTIFSRRYSSGTKRNLEIDIREAKSLRHGSPSKLGEFEVAAESHAFVRRFITSSVDTKAFILMLANHRPKSLISAAEVHIGKVMAAGNRSEFHHLFPQAYLRSQNIPPIYINCLANFCIISASDNKKIGGQPPSKYRARLSDNVAASLESHIIPEILFQDDYANFLDQRTKLLVTAAYKLMSLDPPASALTGVLGYLPWTLPADP